MRGMALIAIAIAAAGMAPTPKRPPPSPSTLNGLHPYLAAGAFDTDRLLPPPPTAGSREEAADLAAYAESAKAKGTPRWDRAMSQVSAFSPAVVAQLACGIGMRIDPKASPALMRMMTRAALDVSVSSQRIKDRFDRPRPYAADPAAVPCDPKAREALNPSYPSGHAAVGWLWALMLTEIAPEHAPRLLSYGVEFGDNRVACRVHYPSDVAAGRTLGAALYARLQGDAAFRDDMAAAKREVAAARAAGPPSGC